MSSATCTRCKQELPVDDFPRHANRKSGRGSWCKPCMREYCRKRYLTKGRDDHKRAHGARKSIFARNREYVNRVKEGGSCADCGLSFPAVAMDFDHVRGDKTDDVARLVGARCSIARIKAEIEKCDLVCANCHRIRHYAEVACVDGKVYEG